MAQATRGFNVGYRPARQEREIPTAAGWTPQSGSKISPTPAIQPGGADQTMTPQQQEDAHYAARWGGEQQAQPSMGGVGHTGVGQAIPLDGMIGNTAPSLAQWQQQQQQQPQGGAEGTWAPSLAQWQQQQQQGQGQGPLPQRPIQTMPAPGMPGVGPRSRQRRRARGRRSRIGSLNNVQRRGQMGGQGLTNFLQRIMGRFQQRRTPQVQQEPGMYGDAMGGFMSRYQ